jgi:hypothetical protein
MTGGAFETTLAGVFARGEQRLGARLAVEKAKADNLQAQDTRRVAFLLTEAIEDELRPAVEEALASYDAAINRPITPNAQWEGLIRRQIGQAVDSAVKLALAIERADHPWKPLLSEEAPKLRARLQALADEHLAELGKVRRRRSGRGEGLPDGLVWALLFAAGVVVGALIMRLLQG